VALQGTVAAGDVDASVAASVVAASDGFDGMRENLKTLKKIRWFVLVWGKFQTLNLIWPVGNLK
jgi:hypothetical protein